jgi:pSer/pThr/pTyr-binding forkhead associated (FHA) protein
MPFRLLVQSKAQTGEAPAQELLLSEDAVTVGRDKQCQVVLGDPAVSRRHLTITREDALYFAADLGSSFGTRINGAALPAKERRLLRDGDVIAIGPYDLTFDRAPEAPSPAHEMTAFVARREVKDALRGLANNAPFLRVMNGPLEGSRFEIQEAQEVIIGREEGVDIFLDDDLISRRHAKIRRGWSGTRIEDLGSRNGVRVNKKKIVSETLKDRDEIEIGGTRFLFIDPSAMEESVVVAPPPPPAGAAGAAGGPKAGEQKGEPEAAEQGGSPPTPPRVEAPATAKAPLARSSVEEKGAEAAGGDKKVPDEGPKGAGTAAKKADPPEAAPSGAPAEHPAGRAQASEAPRAEGASESLDVPKKLEGGAARVRNLVPLVVVVGAAIFAVVVLIIAFFST